MGSLRYVVSIFEHRNDVDHPDEDGTRIRRRTFAGKAAASRWAIDILDKYDGPHWWQACATVEEYDERDDWWYPVGSGQAGKGDDTVEWWMDEG